MPFSLACTVQSSLCGNGLLDEDEQCDDGNQDRFDGCSTTCKLEPYFMCQNAWRHENTPNVPGLMVCLCFTCFTTRFDVLCV